MVEHVFEYYENSVLNVSAEKREEDITVGGRVVNAEDMAIQFHPVGL